ncbi:mitochondrial carrier [Thozetella sp. PMI_491]|nr:mitochondrial carrier [Thozetella sp. PMI_491]
MASNRDGVNPLRPYYIPPSIGDPTETAASAAPGPKAFQHVNTNSTKYASKARDMFNDIDYKDYISEPSPSVVQTVKDLIDELLWKYTSVLMAQPFEVAKTLLQVRLQDDLGALATAAAEEEIKQRNKRTSIYDELPEDSDSDADEMAYFTSNVPETPTPSYPRSRGRRQQVTPPPQSPRIPAKATVPAHQLLIRAPNSVFEVISQLWQKEGAWGVWKGSNATFIYSVLQSLLENWSRSLLSALFNVPDLGTKDDLDRLIDVASPYPWASLFVAAAAAVATGLILSPLDLVRTRLIVTPTSRAPRRTIATLRSLPSYFCPPSLYAPTILHSLIHPLLTLSTPLALRTQFMIDKDVSPTTFSIAKFCASSAALFVKLPLETVLRRGQVAVLSSTSYLRALHVPSPKGKRLSEGTELETVVPPGSYNGVVGTMYAIVNEEGSHAVAKEKAPVGKKAKAKVAETVYRRGQGPDGLWRGWKVSWWGLVGLWAAGVLGGGGDGEF